MRVLSTSVASLAVFLVAILAAGASLHPALADPPPLNQNPRILESTRLNTEFGTAIAAAGDVDGDGYGDLLIGAPSWTSGTQKTGRVLLFRGSITGVELTTDWSRLGESNGADLGRAVAGAGDVNNDGYDDVLLAEPKYSGEFSFEGRIILILGSSVGLADSFAWCWEGGQTEARIGSDMVSLGDVNGDGFADVAIAGHLYDSPSSTVPEELRAKDPVLLIDAGRVWIFHGNASGLESSPAQVLDGEHAGAMFGRALCRAGDIDGDGEGDLLVGAVGHVVDGEPRGAALLFRGPDFADPDWWRARGEEADALFGWSLAAGQLDDTPGRDLLIGAWGVDGLSSQDEGEAYLYMDAALGGVAGTPGGPQGPAWTGSNGKFRASYGFALAVLGDLDSDDRDEFAVGAFRADAGEQIDEGECYLYRGGGVGDIDPPAWTGRGSYTNAFFGQAVVNAGDLDGDGRCDLAVGAPESATAANEPGRVFVYSGGAPPITGVAPPVGPPSLHIASPCHAGSRLAFRLVRDADVRLEIYDLRGRRVRVLLEESRPVGEHGLVFDGRDAHGRQLPAGSYLLRLRADEVTRSTKFIFLP